MAKACAAELTVTFPGDPPANVSSAAGADLHLSRPQRNEGVVGADFAGRRGDQSRPRRRLGAHLGKMSVGPQASLGGQGQEASGAGVSLSESLSGAELEGWRGQTVGGRAEVPESRDRAGCAASDPGDAGTQASA